MDDEENQDVEDALQEAKSRGIVKVSLEETTWTVSGLNLVPWIPDAASLLLTIVVSHGVASPFQTVASKGFRARAAPQCNRMLKTTLFIESENLVTPNYVGGGGFWEQRRSLETDRTPACTLQYKGTPLIEAARNGKSDDVALLIQAKADFEARDEVS